MAWYLGAGWRRFYTQSNPKPVWEPQKNTHPKMKNKLTMFRSVSLVSRSSAESLCSVNSSPGRSLPPTLSHRWLRVRMRSGVVPPGHPWWASRPRVGRGEAEHGCPSFSAVRFSPLFKFYRSRADLPRVHFCCATKWLSYTHASFSLFLSFRCDLGMLSAAPWARREALGHPRAWRFAPAKPRRPVLTSPPGDLSSWVFWSSTSFPADLTSAQGLPGKPEPPPPRRALDLPGEDAGESANPDSGRNKDERSPCTCEEGLSHPSEPATKTNKIRAFLCSVSWGWGSTLNVRGCIFFWASLI